jgi:hypothetical protein
MTYREMFQSFETKGVKVRYGGFDGCSGFKPNEGEEAMKAWMIRVKGEGDDRFTFCCGLDLVGDSKVWVSGDTFELSDPDLFDKILKVVERNERESVLPENIMMCVDYDYYDGRRYELDKQKREQIDISLLRRIAIQLLNTAKECEMEHVNGFVGTVEFDEYEMDELKKWAE